MLLPARSNLLLGQGIAHLHSQALASGTGVEQVQLSLGKIRHSRSDMRLCENHVENSKKCLQFQAGSSRILTERYRKAWRPRPLGE